MAEQQHGKMTVEEFFEWQQSQDRNYELVDGVPVLTPDNTTPNLLMIGTNVAQELARQLSSSTFRVSSSEAPIITRNGVRRPHVLVTHERANSEPEPHCLVHVLVPHREGYDTARRLDEYRELSSVQAVILIDAAAPQAMSWVRSKTGDWRWSEVEGYEANLRLPVPPANLYMAEIYRGV